MQLAIFFNTDNAAAADDEYMMSTTHRCLEQLINVLSTRVIFARNRIFPTWKAHFTFQRHQPPSRQSQ
jgi:hypothetical protein